MSTRAGPAGLQFGPTPKGKRYLSRNDHRSFSRDFRRNRWAASCPPHEEYGIFLQADNNDWYDSRPHLWGLKPHLPVIGTKGERIALFRSPMNNADPWHGYPVSAADRNRELAHRPESPLVDRWLAAGLLSDFEALRIKRGRV